MRKYIEFFSAESKEIMNFALKEAKAQSSKFLKPEHLLLALVEVKGTKVYTLLDRRSITAWRVRNKLEEILTKRSAPSSSTISFDSSLKNIVILAQNAACQDGISLVDTVHLLKGIFRETNNIAAQTLKDLGFEEEMIKH